MSAWSLPIEVVALGVVLGLVQGLLAVGLVLVYRVSRVLHLAHAQVGVFAATVLGLAVTRWHVPYLAAFPLALVVGAGLGVAAEVVVVRRLRHVPRVITIVATLGLGQVLVLLAVAMAGPTSAVAYPEPPGLPAWSLGLLPVSPSTTAMAILGPVAAVVLGIWLRRSRSGLELRAVAGGVRTARLLGIPAGRASATAWGVAGALSAGVAVSMGAAPGFLGADLSATELLLRALAAGVVGRMRSLPVALAAGIGLGVIEQVLWWNLEAGVVHLALLVVVLAALATMRDRSDGLRESWVAVTSWRPLPAAVAAPPPVRWARRVAVVAAAAVVVVTVGVVSNATATRLVALVAAALVASSVGLVTGLAGRLTLGQFGVAGVGAVAFLHVAAATRSVAAGLVAAALAGTVAAVLVALPTVRTRGPLLAVATLAFAVAVESWLLPQSWALGSGVTPAPWSIGPFVADTGRRQLVAALVVAVPVLWACANLRRSGVGRRISAVRDNPAAARALGVDTARSVLLAMALGGAVAGLGGALLAQSLAVVTPAAFTVPSSILVVAMAVVGGIGTAAGPVLGALLLFGLPLLVPLDAAGLVTVAAGWFVLVVYLPQGLAGPAAGIRDLVVGWVTGHRVVAPASPTSPAVTPAVTPSDPRGASLEVRGLRRAFGGVPAVDGIDIVVAPGEVVGLLGPNGAGKTTLVDLLAGFERPDVGRVLLDGVDVTGLSAVTRARMGIARSFQDPRAFPTMTTLDTVRVATEYDRPTRLLPALAGVAERHRTERAVALLDMVGLGGHGHVPVRELSTGMRRICELACLVGLAPRVLLLDEPASGLAAAEVPGLVRLLAALHGRIGMTLVVVEHEPLVVAGLDGRFVTMDRGSIVARPAGAVVEDT